MFICFKYPENKSFNFEYEGTTESSQGLLMLMGEGRPECGENDAVSGAVLAWNDPTRLRDSTMGLSFAHRRGWKEIHSSRIIRLASLAVSSSFSKPTSKP